ncbi:hypothetical protein ABZU32_39045 [Sphaerisporangium sp. NPDC005288]|uniref:hypothetical protein n=1 Tax=Sphaerisporangium sp. NPDC005288 TaxID=3155114 RepID=UPI00339EC1F7
MSIIPLSLHRQPHPPLRVASLAYALTRMEPELRELILPGESWDEMLARREAAADILDDLLAEAGEEFAEAVSA